MYESNVESSNNDECRRSILKRVLRSLNYESTRKALRVTTPSGSRPIVIGLPSDTYGYVIAQAEAHDGAANVIGPKDNTLHVLCLERLTVRTETDDLEHDSWKIHSESSIEMVLEAVRRSNGHLITQLTTTSIELNESDDPLSIPA